MNTSEKIRIMIDALPSTAVASNQTALDEAERLADLYSNVKVVPYRVPVERFIGMSYVMTDDDEMFA